MTSLLARAALVGSSLTDLNFASPLYGVTRRLNRAWIDWANYRLAEKAIDCRVNYAVGGSTIANILAQINAAASASVEWIIGDFGVINSIAGGVSLADMIAQVKQCIDAVAASGKRGAFLNSTPLVVGHASASLATHQKIAAVNRAMATYARSKGVLIIDAHAVIVDGASGYAQPLLLQADLIHYAHTGARLLGAEFADAMASELTAYPLLPCSPSDSYSASNNPDQLCTNPLMMGSSAMTGASGITGNLPTGLMLSSAGGTFTGTSAITPRADGLGQDWIIAVTAASAANAKLYITLAADMTANVAAGDVLAAAAAIDITGAAALKGHMLRLTPSQLSAYAGLFEITTETSGISEYSQADLTGGVFVCPELTLPAGSTNLRLILEAQFASAACAAVFKIGRVGIRRVVA